MVGVEVIKLYLTYNICNQADKGNAEVERIIRKVESNITHVRVSVSGASTCAFSFSSHGTFKEVDAGLLLKREDGLAQGLVYAVLVINKQMIQAFLR